MGGHYHSLFGFIYVWLLAVIAMVARKKLKRCLEHGEVVGKTVDVDVLYFCINYNIINSTNNKIKEKRKKKSSSFVFVLVLVVVVVVVLLLLLFYIFFIFFRHN